MISEAKLESLLARVPDLAIGVVGDFALDAYWVVTPDAAQPSVETGLPTCPILEHRYAAGAAGNVVSNLIALGCKRVSAFGVLGRDPWGDALRGILDEQGACTDGLQVQDTGWSTIAYIKPMWDGREQNRLDFGDFNRLDGAVVRRLLGTLEDALPNLDALVVNAQARSGIHDRRFREGFSALMADRPGPRVFLVDSRAPESMYAGAILKINDREAVRCCGLVENDAPDSTLDPDVVRRAALQLFADRQAPVVVTRGREGMLLCDRVGLVSIPAVKREGRTDTTGAGDAALAGIAAALAGKASLADAAVLGTLAAAVCAGKTGQTGSASPDELRALCCRLPSSGR